MTHEHAFYCIWKYFVVNIDKLSFVKGRMTTRNAFEENDEHAKVERQKNLRNWRLSHEEEPPVPFKLVARWDPETVWTFRRIEKSLAPTGTRTPKQAACSVITPTELSRDTHQCKSWQKMDSFAQEINSVTKNCDVMQNFMCGFGMNLWEMIRKVGMFIVTLKHPDFCHILEHVK